MRKKLITALLLASLTLFTGLASLAADREASASLEGISLSSPALVEGDDVWLQSGCLRGVGLCRLLANEKRCHLRLGYRGLKRCYDRCNP
jgi:hypothetical protein